MKNIDTIVWDIADGPIDRELLPALLDPTALKKYANHQGKLKLRDLVQDLRGPDESAQENAIAAAYAGMLEQQGEPESLNDEDLNILIKAARQKIFGNTTPPSSSAPPQS